MKLPVISGAQAVKALRRIGYEVDVQEGSHIVLRHSQRESSQALQYPHHGQRILTAIRQKRRFQTLPLTRIHTTSYHPIPCKTGFVTVSHRHAFIAQTRQSVLGRPYS